MDQFFAEKLGKPQAPGDVFRDWGQMVDARKRDDGAWSAPEAFLSILVAAAISDGSFTVEERELVRGLAHRSRGLKQLTPEQFDALEWLVVDRFKAGFDVAVVAACDALPQEIRLPAFAQALDIMLSDGAISKAEAAFLDMLVARLAISEQEVESIAKTLVMKNSC